MSRHKPTVVRRKHPAQVADLLTCLRQFGLRARQLPVVNLDLRLIPGTPQLLALPLRSGPVQPLDLCHLATKCRDEPISGLLLHGQLTGAAPLQVACNIQGQVESAPRCIQLQVPGLQLLLGFLLLDLGSTQALRQHTQLLHLCLPELQHSLVELGARCAQLLDLPGGSIGQRLPCNTKCLASSAKRRPNSVQLSGGLPKFAARGLQARTAQTLHGRPQAHSLS
mmetsp:Transcript_53375/g.114727  ORF Transcript_53375/g.114727 Transcript_53375/m.114727 type:complete len:224 (-) Transcript_53375:1034-1705(-)